MADTQLRRLHLLLLFALASVADVRSSSSKNNKQQMSLTFVFDSTMSMNDELEQVKEAMQEIFDYMKVNHPEIVNYALVDFNDPDAKLISMTNDSDVYRKSLNTIDIDGGGDCPEMAIEGIRIALERSLPNSYIIVFTDASAKDYKDEPLVQNLIQEKKSKVIFVLTGWCTDDENEDLLVTSDFSRGYEVFKKIAHDSNGHVFNLQKSEVKDVLEFIKLNTGRKEVICIEEVKDKETGCVAPVDETIKKITVTVTGDHPKITFEDPTGMKVIGNETLHLETALSSTVEDPKYGNWKIKVRVLSSGRFMVTADSSFSVIYGFSINATEEMMETTSRPFADVNNTILIRAINNTDSIHLINVKLKDSEYNIFNIMKLNPVSSRNDTYKSEMFHPPNFTFFLEVTGIDIKNNSVSRISESGITALPPGLPVISPETEFTATLKFPFNLMCHIKSLVPFTASWYKEDLQITPEKHFFKTAEFYHLIDNITMSSAGVYTCQAKNSVGTVSQSITLHVKAPVPVVNTPDKIEIEENKSVEIPCQVKSDLNYTVNWTKKEKSESLQIINGRKFTIRSSGALFISLVQTSDEGVYQCVAHSKSGDGKNSTFIKVIEPVKVTVTSNTKSFKRNEKVLLTCSASGLLPIILQWKKNDVELQKSDPRIKVLKENKLVLSIIESQKSDEGLYKCVGSNNFSSSMS